MNYQLSTFIVQTILAILTFVAVLSVWLIPIWKDCKKKKEQASITKRGVSLYLDAFELKLENALDDLKEGIPFFPEKSSFEQVNKKNYGAIEKFFLSSDSLETKEINKLMEFVRYFKISQNMRTKEDVETFLDKVKDRELRHFFPASNDLVSAIEKQRKLRKIIHRPINKS